ncbi:DinB family protein [Mucilaginibacter sp. CSA2-8R]|uniref:DinB family protein n=1 Tax=Mucilaginibacter sp. CSA2-8R TaxID=3141542 RepID=UPI00315DC0A4
MANLLPEVWLRGPLPEVPALLQPVAHALLQAREEINALMADFDEEMLWTKPAELASAGFHLQHLTGVLDRLFTYARGKMLTPEQLNALHQEGKPLSESGQVQILLNNFNRQVDLALEQLTAENSEILTEVRGVGRAQTPSTVIGLYTHAAEHTMRHVGQLLVTVKILQSGLY